jgi:site-specific recombinase XerD
MVGTVTLARAAVRDGRTEVFIGEDLDADAGRFLDAVRARGLSSLTVRAYAFDLVRFYRWLPSAKRRLDELVASDLVDFIADQQRVGAAPRSINRRLTTVCLFFRFKTGRDLDHGVLGLLRPAPYYKGPGRDHALGLHRLTPRVRKIRVKEPRTIVEPLTPDQVRSFLRSLRRYRDLAIVHLMLLCGLRSKEVLDLELGDVVWADDRLRVRGKGRRDRALPLPALLARILRDYVRVERPAKTHELRLFLVLQGRRRGRPMTAAGLRNLFRHRRRRPTLARAHAHRFRHTFGADMARAGVRLPILQRMMGHADLKTTLQYIELSLVDVADEYKRAIASIEGRYARARR